MQKYFYPIFKLPDFYVRDYQKQELPLWVKWWLLGKAGRKLSEILTGSEFTLLNTVARKFKIFELGGRTEQEQLSGKNLANYYDASIQSGDEPRGTVQATENGFNYNISQNLGNGIGVLIPIDLKSGETYILNFDLSTRVKISNIHLQQSTDSTSYQNISNRTAFTCNDNFKYLRLYIANENQQGVNSGSVSNIMINNGSTAESFEQYCGGIPSPNSDFPQQIKNVTGNANEKIFNKNLFDKTNYIETQLAIGFDISKLKIGETYTISSNLPISLMKISNTSGGYNSVVASNFSNYTFVMTRNSNIPEGANQYIFFRLTGSSGFTTDISEFVNYNIQIELGSTATSYVPHQEQNYPFTFAEGQRAMQGTTLQDDGIHNKRKHYVYTGNENLYLSGYTDTLSAVFRSEFTDIKIGGTQGKCNIGSVGIIDNIYTNINGFFYNNVGQQAFLKIQKSSIPNWDDSLTNEQKVELFKAFLGQRYANNNPVEVEYELATEEIILYNETQQAQYNAKKQAKTYKDVTYITSESDELAPELKIQYWKEKGVD